jgi:hypothetical protein
MIPITKVNYKPIIYLNHITRSRLKQELNARFVFGDNVIRQGFGGQAKEMRGEPNAIGVATKHKPTMDPDAFFRDCQGDAELLKTDLKKVEEALRAGLQVYAPEAGLGTGLSQLPSRAPGLYKILCAYFGMRSVSLPWPIA